MATIRRRRNHITSLQNDTGQWIENSNDLEKLATDYYKGLFSTDSAPKPFPISHSFPSLDEDAVRDFARQVSDEEILSTIKSFGSLKALGPNGFQALLYQSQWEVVGASFCKMIRDIFAEPWRVG